MGNEDFLVSLPASKPSKQIEYGKQIDALMPYYLHIGMTPEQFLDGDPDLCLFYRKKHKLDIEERNQELWLQGAYIYDALHRLAPAWMFQPPSGWNTIEPYVNEPYCLDEEERKQKELEKKRKAYEAQMERMLRFMKANNNKFERGGE